jgi:hypothetical protein
LVENGKVKQNVDACSEDPPLPLPRTQTLFDAWHEKYCGSWEHVDTCGRVGEASAWRAPNMGMRFAFRKCDETCCGVLVALKKLSNGLEKQRAVTNAMRHSPEPDVANHNRKQS